VLAVAHSKGGVVQVPPPPPPCSPTAPQLPRSPPPTCPRRCRSPAVLAVALGRGGIVQVPPLPPPCSPTALWLPRSPPRRPIVRSLRVAPARAPPPRCQKRASSSRPAGSQTLPPSACRAARLLRHSAPPRAHARPYSCTRCTAVVSPYQNHSDRSAASRHIRTGQQMASQQPPAAPDPILPPPLVPRCHSYRRSPPRR
jgi:hypothetical protein